MFAEVEARFTAVERIHAYALDLPAEGVAAAGAPAPETPPAEWPAHGAITLEDLEVRYRPELPPVLRRVSLAVPGCTRVGVAGRTGSGKSTLMTALFRLLEPTHGRILIDGVDIAHLDLATLRSRLSIIPQVNKFAWVAGRHCGIWLPFFFAWRSGSGGCMRPTRRTGGGAFLSLVFIARPPSFSNATPLS